VMATILLVEDDHDQLELRTLTLETAGHSVRPAAGAGAALEQAEGADVAVLDLRIPAKADGLGLIETLRERWPAMKLIVMSGWGRDLHGLGVDATFEKPVRTKELLKSIARLSVLLLCCGLRAATFEMPASGEAEAVLELSAPGKSWGERGRESVLADVVVDGKVAQQVMVYSGETPHSYRVFLGALAKGPHAVEVQGAVTHSIKAAPAADYVRHAPVLFERKNAVGKFTDIPLLTYCEALREDGARVLQYSVIFSNEDGGTSTRSLMARWGRTTDIEYVYRVWLNADGSRRRAIVQGRNHQDQEFTGPFDGDHPLLMPVTDNNMVAGEGPSAVRYQPSPFLADLRTASRETVMDANPQTWRIMTAELVREGKLRPYGEDRGETISDPRNYLYIEASVKPGKAGVAFVVKHANGRYYYSHTGRTKDAVARDGWVRSTIELPPGTKQADLVSINSLCVYLPATPSDFPCAPAAIKYQFLLGPDMLPGPRFSLPGAN
jgi:CheY-like chemotaxis protein